MGCTFKFSDGTSCGKPLHRNFKKCHFHQLCDQKDNINIQATGFVDSFNAYVKQSDKKILNLSNLKFYISKFEKQHLPNIKLIVFDQCSLNGCEIDCELITVLSNVKLNNCKLINTDKLELIVDSFFDETHFTDLTFEKCRFMNFRMLQSRIVKTTFNNCELFEGSFENVQILNSSKFISCGFVGFGFNNSFILQTKFKQCSFSNLNNIEETEFKTCEFDDVVFVSIFKKSQFTECEFISKTVFDTSQFDTNTPIYTDCNFNGLFEENFILSFAECKVKATSSMFENCFMSGSLLSFKNLDLKCDNLYLNNTEDNREVERNYETLNTSRISKIDYTGLKFKGHFKYNQIKEYENDDIEIRFTGVNFDNMDSAQIINANLENTTFKNSSIEKVKFYNCKWKKYKGFSILRDELKKYDFKTSFNVADKELLRLYVQLKKNFEASRNMIDAGDWYYREMEARRRSLLEEPTKKVRNKLRYLLKSIYKLVSSYGESYLKPLCWILTIWVSFSFLYMFDGFALTNDNYINYSFESGHEFSREYITDFLRALLYSFSNIILPFKNGTDFVDENNKILTITQFFSMVILLPLFLLALRRKFKR